MFFKNETPKLIHTTSLESDLHTASPQEEPEEVISPSHEAVVQEPSSSGCLIVGADVRLQGSFTVPIKTTVSGLVDGNLATSDLIVKVVGRIQGQVRCQTADIAGQIENLLHVHEYLVLRSSAVVIGEIYYQEIAIEKGAKINGKLVRL